MAKILLIDDDDQFRQMLKKRLERAGFGVTEAVNGLDGVRHLRESTPDLVVTDLIMPEQEGIDTIAQIRNTHPDLKIIAISGGGKVSADSYLPIAQAMGAVRTFAKPLDWERFLKEINELIPQEHAS